MAIINFPTSPALYQTFTLGTKTWIWNGYAWDLQLANTSTLLANTGSQITVNGNSIVYIANTLTSTSNATGALRIAGGVGVQGNVYASNVYVLNDVIAGLQDGTALGGATNPIIASIGNNNNYVQSYIINYSNSGNSSADFVAYPNNGQDSSGWVDMGITAQTYNQLVYSSTGPNEGYLFMSAPVGSSTSGNLVIATDVTGTYNSIEFYTGGFQKTKGTANVVITTTTNSSSNTTGTLVVKGGIGATGNVYSDKIYTNGLYYAANGNPISTGGGSVTLSDSITSNSSANAATSNAVYIAVSTALAFSIALG
jgi:hypothetical protein